MAKTVKEQLGVDFDDPIRPTAEVIEQTEAGVDDRPEWLPENFKSPEEFAAAYKSSQDKIREQGETAARERRETQEQITNLTNLVQGLQPTDRQENNTDWRAQLQDNFENDPIGTMALLARQYAEQTVDERLTAMQQQQSPQLRQQAARDNELLAFAVDNILGQRHDDWNDYKEQVSREIQQDPTLLSESVLHSPELTARSLERVYDVIKAKEILSQHENGTLQSTRMKQQAQSLSSTTVRPGTPTSEEQQIDAIIAAAKGMSYSSLRGS